MRKSGVFVFGMIIFLTPFFVSAISITEIMYDLEGTDSGHEWVEIFNNSNQEVILTGGTKGSWRFNDGSNHLLSEFPAQGSMTIPASGYAIFAASTTIFLLDHQNFQGTVIGTAMSLNNTGATLKLIDNNSSPSEIFSVSYTNTMGAAGDGNSLQYVNGNWIAAAPTPGAINAGVSELPSPQPENSSVPQASQSSSGGNSVYVAPEKLPHIKVSAGPDKNVVVGALSEFRGQGFGLKNEPLENARYLWVFGDGSLREGQNVNYFYQYPGEYIVALNVASGEYSASDYLHVKAAPNQFFISEIKPGENGWIEFENKSKEEIDISGCQIKQASQIFTFPQSTRVKSGAFLVIPASVSKINFSSGKGIAEFFYSGGFKADSFSYEGFVSESQSYNRGASAALVAQESPAAKNLIPSDIIKTASVSAPKKEGSSTTVAKNTSNFSDSGNNGATSTNPAAIVIGQSGNTKSNALIYLAAAFGVAISAVVAIFFINRKRGGEHFL